MPGSTSVVALTWIGTETTTRSLGHQDRDRDRSERGGCGPGDSARCGATGLELGVVDPWLVSLSGCATPERRPLDDRHIAVPDHTEVGGVEHHDATGLSDHDAYVVTVGTSPR